MPCHLTHSLSQARGFTSHLIGKVLPKISFRSIFKSQLSLTYDETLLYLSAPLSMDSQPENDPPAIISDRVLVNGVVTPLLLTIDGELRWTESGRRKSTAEILSFVVEGNKVRVKTLVERGGGICCRENAGDYTRKDFVFESLSDESRKLWCDKLHQHLQSLGQLNLDLSPELKLKSSS